MLVDVTLERKLRIETSEAFADHAFKGVGAGVGDVMAFQPIEGRGGTIEHFAAQPSTDELLGGRRGRRRIA